MKSYFLISITCIQALMADQGEMDFTYQPSDSEVAKPWLRKKDTHPVVKTAAVAVAAWTAFLFGVLCEVCSDGRKNEYVPIAYAVGAGTITYLGLTYELND